ncbi:type IV secretory system conjugative DNA transfer family protein [Bradyrhizobium zhanjiangense]|uniref:TraD/TraG TraM recognition site domain-containing protein n=1 Tax=Bradyrhizobium zhanjiangense TaxID=1325107 RepID=A0ABY0D979_9BRAD|nr:type IV secretory system conjugative DNA transfer family protein [Bradyrhizobium zhanjiangense]RXG84924.1 hypothetical protein EAS62_39320 [Bradyrhizobium zhanjiangense]
MNRTCAPWRDCGRSRRCRRRGTARHHRQRGRARGPRTGRQSPRHGRQREYRSVLSNAEKATRLRSSASPAREISTTSTAQPAELVSEVSTIYLAVGEEKLTVHAGFLRVMVGCVVNALTRGKHLPRPIHKVLLLLDEASALGSLEPLERGVGYLRAYCIPLPSSRT